MLISRKSITSGYVGRDMKKSVSLDNDLFWSLSMRWVNYQIENPDQYVSFSKVVNQHLRIGLKKPMKEVMKFDE